MVKNLHGRIWIETKSVNIQRYISVKHWIDTLSLSVVFIEAWGEICATPSCSARAGLRYVLWRRVRVLQQHIYTLHLGGDPVRPFVLPPFSLISAILLTA